MLHEMIKNIHENPELHVNGIQRIYNEVEDRGVAIIEPPQK